MEVNRPAVNATGDGEFRPDRLCGLLDELVAMQWNLSKRLRDNPNLPASLTVRVRRVGGELELTIDALKSLIGEPGLPV